MNRTCVAAEPILDFAVVGGGLSGLVVASGIASGSSSSSFALLEASPSRWGGRLHNDGAGLDLGGAWVWPGQRKVEALLGRLGIGTFAQPGEPGSLRVAGGAAALVGALVEALPGHAGHGRSASPTASTAAAAAPPPPPAAAAHRRISLGWELAACEHVPARAAVEQQPAAAAEEHVRLTSVDGGVVRARRVVLAVPPRLLLVGGASAGAAGVRFTPELRPARRAAMLEARTWMAGVTKVALSWEAAGGGGGGPGGGEGEEQQRPARFWRARDVGSMGLRGGPAFQVYDASTEGDDVVGLTFFALATAEPDDAALVQQCVRQLATAWGQQGVARATVERLLREVPARATVQRWPLERLASDEAQPQTIHPHPHPRPELARPEWGGRLLFAGTECDQSSPGVIEGAIGAAHGALAHLGLSSDFEIG
jgi:monoamine oxidase